MKKKDICRQRNNLSDEKQEDSVGSEAILNSIKEGNLEKSEAIF